MIRAKTDKMNWVICGECGHKLMRVVEAGECNPPPTIEIKCHSCKGINVWNYDGFNEIRSDKR